MTLQTQIHSRSGLKLFCLIVHTDLLLLLYGALHIAHCIVLLLLLLLLNVKYFLTYIIFHYVCKGLTGMPTGPTTRLLYDYNSGEVTSWLLCSVCSVILVSAVWFYWCGCSVLLCKFSILSPTLFLIQFGLLRLQHSHLSIFSWCHFSYELVLCVVSIIFWTVGIQVVHILLLLTVLHAVAMSKKPKTGLIIIGYRFCCLFIPDNVRYFWYCIYKSAGYQAQTLLF